MSVVLAPRGEGLQQITGRYTDVALCCFLNSTIEHNKFKNVKVMIHMVHVGHRDTVGFEMLGC